MESRPPPIQEKTANMLGLFPQTWIKWFQHIYDKLNELEGTIMSYPLTAFGELSVAESSPIFQYSFEYTVDNTELNVNIKTGAAAT